MDTKRIPYIDFGAGIMILWMIFQHAVQSAWAIDPSNPGLEYQLNPNVWFPYLNFFMPWFFYKSGAFFQKRSIKDLLLKDCSKFLRIFLIWSLIGYVVYLLLGAYDHTLSLHEAIRVPTKRFFFTGFIAINAPLWFLLTLFGVRFLANICLPQSNEPYIHLKCAILVMFGVLIAYGAYVYNNSLLPLWIANGAAGLSFFVLGYWLHNYERHMWLLILCIFCYICSCVLGWNSVCMHTNVLLEGNYLLWFPSALCGIICFNATCRIVCDAYDNFTPPRHSHTLYRAGWSICNADIRNTCIYSILNPSSTKSYESFVPVGIYSCDNMRRVRYTIANNMPILEEVY